MISPRQNQPLDFPADADIAEESASLLRDERGTAPSSLSETAAEAGVDVTRVCPPESDSAVVSTPLRCAADGASGDPATVKLVGASPLGTSGTHETKSRNANTQSVGAHGVTRPTTSTDADYVAALALAEVCERFLQLTGEGQSLRAAAQLCGKSVSFFSGEDSMYRRWQKRGVEGLLKQRGTTGAKPKDLTEWIESLPWFIPAANHFYLLTNRTWKSGSMPEALRRVISLPALPVGWKQGDINRFLKVLGQGTALPVCPPELRDLILERERKGMPMVPERVAKKIRLNPATVRQHRNARETTLDLLSSPGAMRLFTLPDGTRRLARAGEIIEADDATVNFPVCVPWERDGSDDPCVQKFGVKVARFQWLVSICAGTSYVTGFSYTARPKSSYRAEDIVSLMRIITRQHGVPKQWRFERGNWESKLVEEAIKNMGAKLETVYSPHQKPFIEGLFNTLWTKLSVHFPGGHVGRYMGEERDANLLLAACKAGHKDPRRYFPMLSTAIAAFHEVIAEKNRTPVNTAHHGRWIPEERWEVEKDMRQLDGASDWMFAPFIREWTVRGMLVGGRVPVFEKISVPFDFSAHWLTQYDGARVKVYFDPADPRCSAMLVLAERFGDQAAGTLLGKAAQVNDTASYVRLMMGWGDDPAMLGVKARQQAQAALRREVRAVLPRGQRGASASEERDGLGKVTKVEQAGPAPHVEPAPADDNPQPSTINPQPLIERERKAAEYFANPLDFV